MVLVPANSPRFAIRRLEFSGESRWGLALSGGGFRATLYHLGVIRVLRERGLLQHITDIASVSGGSVIAAHLVLNWSRYTGTDQEFDEAADELVRFIASDVRGRIIRAWIFRHVALFPKLARWRASRVTQLLQKQYARFFGDKNLGELDDPPKLHILATSFTSGMACAFCQDKFISGVGTEIEPFATSQIPLSAAVAASSAFPPLFPPLALTREMLALTKMQYPHTQYLGDGGVYDNVGVRMLAWLRKKEDCAFDGVVLSDAGAKIDWSIDDAYGFVVSRSIRASNVLMQRVSDLEHEDVAKRLGLADDRVIRLQIDEELPQDDPYALDPEVQRATARLRTDLDAFSPYEINALVVHGYAVTASHLPNTDPKSAETWLPPSTRTIQKIESEEWTKKLQRGADFHWRLWSWSDLNSWKLAGVLMLLLGGLAWFAVLAPRFRAYDLERVNATLVSDLRSERFEKARVVEELSRQNQNRTWSMATLNELFRTERASLVTINRGRTPHPATGFFVGRSGQILTTASALPPSQEASENPVAVTLADGSVANATVSKIDTAVDLALLQIDKEETVPIELAETAPAAGTSAIALTAIAEEPVATGEVITVNADNVVWQSRETYIPEVGTPILQPDGKASAIHLRTTAGKSRGLSSMRVLQFLRQTHPEIQPVQPITTTTY